MTKSQELVLKAILPCQRAIFNGEAWTLERVRYAAALPQMPSPESPVVFETSVFVELFAANPPVEDGRLRLTVRGPAGESLGASETAIDWWKDNPQGKHLGVVVNVALQVFTCGVLSLEVSWNEHCLGSHEFELRPPGASCEARRWGSIPSKVLEPADAA
jgi:hypothetical protein